MAVWLWRSAVLVTLLYLALYITAIEENLRDANEALYSLRYDVESIQGNTGHIEGAVDQFARRD